MEKGPQMPTPAEMAENEKKRIISDGNLVQGGAEIRLDEKGNRINLFPTENQMRQIEFDALSKEEQNARIEKKSQEIVAKFENMLKEKGIEIGDDVKIYDQNHYVSEDSVELGGIIHRDRHVKYFVNDSDGIKRFYTVPILTIEKIELVKKNIK